MENVIHERSGHRGAFVRAENARLLPLCPFARSVFDKTPAYSDVLVK